MTQFFIVALTVAASVGVDENRPVRERKFSFVSKFHGPVEERLHFGELYLLVAQDDEGAVKRLGELLERGETAAPVLLSIPAELSHFVEEHLSILLYSAANVRTALLYAVFNLRLPEAVAVARAYAKDEEETVRGPALDKLCDVGDQPACHAADEMYRDLCAANRDPLGVVLDENDRESGVVRITHICADGAAKIAGLSVGDVITGIDDIGITSRQALEIRLSPRQVRTKFRLNVKRGSRSLNVEVQP